ncbi:MAG: sulfatase [Planctomycetota bacterium]
MKKNQGKQQISRRSFMKRGFYAGGASGLLAGLWLSGCSARVKRRPNILLITLDTTRADRLGCYGYDRGTSPNLDQLAAGSVLYTNALATASSTLPSHASVFTGKFTTSHGARRHPEGPLRLTAAIPGPEHWNRYRAFGLSMGETTLASILKRAGYETGAVVAGPWLKKVFGLSQGFDYFDDSGISSLNGRIAKDVTASALKWLKSRSQAPFFLFLNYFDPHSPYAAPEGFASRFLPADTHFEAGKPTAEELNALYDAEILYMDSYIGTLLDSLKSEGLYDETWIIVTADHGELMGEHSRFGHGDSLTQPEIRIPLFMKYAADEDAPCRVNTRVQTLDIMPTICEYLKVPVPKGTQGHVLSNVRHPILAEAYPIEITSSEGHWRALFEQDFKLLWNSKGNHALYDLKSDPGENDNLAQRKPQQVQGMMERLDQYLAVLPKPVRQEKAEEMIDPETAESLQNLGYIK